MITAEGQAAGAPVILDAASVRPASEVLRSSAARYYRPQLDILRFLAFLAVFVFHAVDRTRLDLQLQHVPKPLAFAILGLTRGGAYGVDLFFVLSAYLITELLQREQQANGSYQITAFYIRRILRIWPLYFFFLLLVACVPALDPGRDFTALHVVLFSLFLGNWDYFFLGWSGYVIVPLWSISVEEQFYLCWPLLMARLSGRRMLWIAILMIGVAYASRVWGLFEHQTARHLWTSTLAHLDSIAAGVLLATLWREGRMKLDRGLRLILIVAAIAALVAQGTLQGIAPGELLHPLSTLLGAPLAVLACATLVWVFIDWPLHSAPLQYLGKISYGLYVFHMLALMLVDRYLHGSPGPVHSALRFAVALGLSISLAALSYALLERPFLLLKERFTPIPSRPA